MSVNRFGYLQLQYNLLDFTNNTKQLKIDLSTLPASTTRIIRPPVSNTTLIGTDTMDTLTNKTIKGTTNNVDANALKVVGGGIVSVSASPAPAPGQTLIASSSIEAKWADPSILFSTLYLINETAVTTSTALSLKQYHGQRKTPDSAGVFNTMTFYVTTTGRSTGVPLFTNLDTCYLYASARRDVNSNSSTIIPFVSIKSVNNTNGQVVVNIQLGNAGSIVGGGTYTGMRSFVSGGVVCNVCLYVVGT